MTAEKAVEEIRALKRRLLPRCADDWTLEEVDRFVHTVEIIVSQVPVVPKKG